MAQYDFQNKETLTSPAWLSFVLKVPLRHLRPSEIYSVPCDWILQRAYCWFSFSSYCMIISWREANIRFNYHTLLYSILWKTVKEYFCNVYFILPSVYTLRQNGGDSMARLTIKIEKTSVIYF